MEGLSGGGFSLYRFTLGLCACLQLGLWWVHGTGGNTPVFGAGIAASVPFALGFKDRFLGPLLGSLWLFLLSTAEIPLAPGSVVLGLLLLAHAAWPAAPYGSWDARGRPDPGGGWRMGRGHTAALWTLLILANGLGGGLGWFHGPWLRVVAIGFVVLALGTRWTAHAAQPWVWFALLAAHLWNAAILSHRDESLGMALLHLAAFNPSWAPPKGAPGTVYFDGHCGLCHRSVRFLLAEDTAARFELAPLQGITAENRLGKGAIESLPDSIVLQSGGQDLRFRADAVFVIALGLGGPWRVLGSIARVFPLGLWNLGYRGISRARRRIFKTPPTLCPLVPKNLGSRFLP